MEIYVCNEFKKTIKKIIYQGHNSLANNFWKIWANAGLYGQPAPVCFKYDELSETTRCRVLRNRRTPQEATVQYPLCFPAPSLHPSPFSSITSSLKIILTATKGISGRWRPSGSQALLLLCCSVAIGCFNVFGLFFFFFSFIFQWLWSSLFHYETQLG